jgi:hypothetical protein
MLYEIEYRRPGEAGITGRLQVLSAAHVEEHTSRLMDQGYVITNVHPLSRAETNTGHPAVSSFE